MTEIDWIICALLVLSTVVGIMRGVIREVLSIVGLPIPWANDLIINHD